MARAMASVIGHADGVMQPPGLHGQPGEELVRAAAGISADQYLAPQVARKLRDRQPGRVGYGRRRCLSPTFRAAVPKASGSRFRLRPS